MRLKFVALLISVLLFGGYAKAYDFSAVCESGQTLYYNITSNVEPYTVKVTSENSGSPYYTTYPTGNLVIPEMVEYNGVTYSVTSIGQFAFTDCNRLTSTTIPNSVTSIGQYAFYGCSGLTSVTIGNSVTSIGENAFSNCSGVTTVNFNATNCTTMGSSSYPVFNGCSSLSTLNIGENVTNIPRYAFYRCNGLTEVTIPNSVTSIGGYAFSDCSRLTSVNFNASNCASVGVYVWYGSSLSTLNIGENVTNIPEYSFENCSGLTSVTISNSVTSIGASAFSGCSGLTSVTIPNSVTSIGANAFSDCSGLTSITIPSSVTSIGGCAFYRCSRLTTVNFNATNCTTMGSSSFAVFSNCTSFTTLNIGGNVTNIPEYAFKNSSGLTSVTIPNSVTSIGGNTFYGCSGLTSVTIPNSVTSIGQYAFYGCSGLISVTIPNSVTSIGSSAFSGCSGLTSVTIPNSVTSIGNSAFSNCSGLNTVNFNATNCTTMGSSYYPVFQNCNENAVINIGEGVETIPGYAFKGLLGNGVLIIPNSVTSIGSYAFSGCSGLTSVTITSSVTSIGNGTFRECRGLTSITIPNSVTSISYGAFEGCSGLTSVTIPNSVTSIGDNAFRECTGLTSVTIPNSVTSIGFDAFYRVRNIVYGGTATGSPWGALTVNGIFDGDFIYSDTERTNLTAYIGNGGDVVIPNSVTSIGNFAFYECTGLTSVTIPNSVTSIGASAFSGCSGLTSVTISNSVTSIRASAFYGCGSLTSVTIPNSVTSIGNNAFSGCSSLTAVNFNATNCTTMGSYSYPAFQDCNANAIINIGEGVTTIPDYAFSGLLGNGVLIIPNSVTSIGVDAFYGCSGLTSVTIGNSVTSVGSFAFSGCSGLTGDLIIPNSVVSIGTSAFSNCRGLTSVTIGNSVTSIGTAAFYSCSGLVTVNFNATNCLTMGKASSYSYTPVFRNCTSFTTLNIGENVTNIPDSAFYGCSSLVTAEMPDVVARIGGYSFYGCSGLSDISIPNSVVGVGENAFTNTGWYNSHSDGILYQDRWYLGYKGDAPVGELELNVTTRGVAAGAFAECTGVTSVTMPGSMITIGEKAFKNCLGVGSVYIPDSVQTIGDLAFYMVTNIVYNGNASGRPWGALSMNGYNLDGIFYTSMAKDTVLSALRTIESANISNSVVCILPNAFRGCVSLTEINIPDSVKVIGEYAFAGCSNVSTLTIGSAVDSIASSAFDGCQELSVVNFNATDCNSVGSNIYYNCTSFTTLNIGENVTNIPKYAFIYCSRLTSVTIPNSVTSIGNSAFSNCSGLTSVTIGNSVTSIGYSAFSNCSGLTSITIPSSVTSIGGFAFSHCSNLSVINYNAVRMDLEGDVFYRGTNNAILNIGDSVVIIPDQNFFSTTSDIDLAEINVSSANPIFDSRNGCNAVIETATNKLVLGCKNTIIPNTVTNIADGAFMRNPYLTSINIPNSVTRIGDWAFFGCSGLTSVSIGNSVDSIYARAFDYCRNLADIYVKSTIPPHINSGTFDSDNYRSATLWVPCGYAEVYDTAAVWGNFNDIRESRAYLLSVESNNNIWGTANVTQQPNCDDGIAVISATANEHYRFVQWSDGNTENPRTVIVEGDTVFTAEFAGFPYTITVESVDTEMGSVVGGGTYDYGTEIQISAIANDHSYFVQWSDGNTDNPRTVVVEGDTTYTAMFAIDQHTITVLSDDENLGSVVGGGTYDYGAEIQISAIANDHSYFVQWSDGNTDNPRTIIVTGDTTYTAMFAIDQHTITVLSDDENLGSVVGGGTYDYGTEIQISATAIEGYAFLSWNDGNTDNPRTIIVEGNTTFTAIFDEARTVTLETSNSEMGTVIGSGVYAVGAVVEITAVPNEGYSFDHWVDVYNPSREINTDNPRTIVVSSDVTYMAVFTDVVGIEDNSVPEITIFPNPTNDILNITSSETISEIEIVNMNGQVVRRVEINGDNAVCNVADLKAGVYIVRISAASATLSQRKFVKE